MSTYLKWGHEGKKQDKIQNINHIQSDKRASCSVENKVENIYFNILENIKL